MSESGLAFAIPRESEIDEVHVEPAPEDGGKGHAGIRGLRSLSNAGAVVDDGLGIRVRTRRLDLRASGNGDGLDLRGSADGQVECGVAHLWRSARGPSLLDEAIFLFWKRAAVISAIHVEIDADEAERG